MNNIQNFDYDEIEAHLSSQNSTLKPSELHGLLCGYLCAIKLKKGESFLKDVIGNREEGQLNPLNDLYEFTKKQLKDFSFEFSLLLPADDAEINTRAEALGQWCQGFLTALNQAGVPLEKGPPGDVTDTLKDLLEIAQVNYGDITETEEDETAYTELAEYVRLAVLMIYQELAESPVEKTPKRKGKQ